MWQYNNIIFIYKNDVDSVHGQKVHIPHIKTYLKSKHALIQALNMFVMTSSYLGPYAEIDHRTVKFDKPFKV